MSSDFTESDTVSSKQQRFFDRANSLAIPSAPKDVTEIVKTSGSFLFLPIPNVTRDWQSNDISWLLDNVKPPQATGITTTEEAVTFARYIGTYVMEIATLLTSLSENSGTPTSLNNRTNINSEIYNKDNYPTVAEVYKFVYGTEATIPNGSYNFNPLNSRLGTTVNTTTTASTTSSLISPAVTSTGATPPPPPPQFTINPNGTPNIIEVDNTTALTGVSAADSAKLLPNWRTGLSGKTKIELPVTNSFEFDPCIAEAIGNIENKLPAYQETNKSSNSSEQAEDTEESDLNTMENDSSSDNQPTGDQGTNRRRRNQQASETGPSRRGTRNNRSNSRTSSQRTGSSGSSTNNKKFSSICQPWSFKSRNEDNDRFVYPYLNRIANTKYTDPISVHNSDLLYSEYLKNNFSNQQNINNNNQTASSSSTLSSDDNDEDEQMRLIYRSSSRTGIRPGQSNGNNSDRTSLASLKIGYFGFPLLPKVKLPKLIPYILYVPAENGTYHQIVALKIIDPHFDPIVLCKRIQQTLLDKHNRKEQFFENRDVGMYSVPQLNEGFHNENLIFSKKGNPSLADSPQLFFRFLYDYLRLSSSSNGMAFISETIQKEAETMASDPNYDAYASISHPLNLNNLFSFEKAINVLANISKGKLKSPVVVNLQKVVKEIDIQDSSDPLMLDPPRLNLGYTIDLSDFMDPENENRFRCYRYRPNNFRWCYYDKMTNYSGTGGLVTEMMPHVHPVFQLDDSTYTEILNREKTKASAELARKNQLVSGGGASQSTRSTNHLDHDLGEMDISNPDNEDDEYGGISNLVSMFNEPSPHQNGNNSSGDNNNSNRLFKAPAWTHLLDIEDICLQTDIKALPNSKLPVGYDSFFVYLVLLETLITGPLSKLQPNITIGMRVINYLINTLTFGKMHKPRIITDNEQMMDFEMNPNRKSREEKYLSRKVTEFVQSHNEYFNHLEKHRRRIVKFTTNYFFNPSTVKRIGKVIGDGWKYAIKHYNDLLKKSKSNFGLSLVPDMLKPSYYGTMADGWTMRGPNDSVIGAFFEAQARRMYEQFDLYQNNSLFFVGILGSVMCIFRMDGRDKFNMLFIGPFAAGKSHLTNIIIPCCLKNFVLSLQSSTEQALIGCGLSADRLIICSEGFNLIEENPTLLKGVTTDSNANKSVCSYDSKTGQRVRSDYYGGFFNGFIIAQNELISDAALASRFFRPLATRDNKIIDKSDKKTNFLVEERKRDDLFIKLAKELYDGLFLLKNYVLAVDGKSVIYRNPTNSITASNIQQTNGNNKKKYGLKKPNPPLSLTQTPDVIISDVPAEEESRPPIIVVDDYTTTSDDNDLISIPNNPFSKSSGKDDQGFVHKTPSTNNNSHNSGREEIEQYWQHTQLAMFFLHKLQATRVIAKTSTTVWDLVQPRLKEKVEAHFPDLLTRNPRILDRIKTIIINVCDIDAIRRVLYDSKSPYYNKPLRPEYLRAVEPYLSVTFDHIAIAVSVANDEIVDNPRAKIIMAFLKISGFYLYGSNLMKLLKSDDSTLNNETQPESNKPRQEDDPALILNALSVYKEAIKLNREFCEKTDFHKVHWYTKERDFSDVHIPMEISPNPNPSSALRLDDDDNNTDSMDTTPDVAVAPSSGGIRGDQLKISAKRTQYIDDTDNAGQQSLPNNNNNNTIPTVQPSPPLRSQPPKISKPPLLYQPSGKARERNFCIDFNKICLKIPTNIRSLGAVDVHGNFKMVTNTLKKELTRGNCGEIGDNIFSMEIGKLSSTSISKTESRFRPISYSDYVNAVNGEKTILITAEDNEKKSLDEVSIISSDGGKNDNLLTYDVVPTGNGQGELHFIMDIQALKYLDGFQIITNILLEISREIPLHRTRIPLLFHGPGAELSWINVGSDLSSSMNEESPSSMLNVNDPKSIRFQSKSLDPYRAILDYNMPGFLLNEKDQESQDKLLFDDENDKVELSRLIDINDYGRIIHIMYNNIFSFTIDSGDSKLKMNVVDYTKQISHPNRTTKQSLDYFLEQSRKKERFNQFKDTRLAYMNLSRKRPNNDNNPASKIGRRD